MIDRPYVLLSCAASVDGYIDDTSPERLLLSNDADFDRVDEVRAGCDAILVGANTIRRDNPRLLVRSAQRRDARVAKGLSSSPMKVTLSSSGELDPRANFFTAGDTSKIVYCAAEVPAGLHEVATVVRANGLTAILADLAQRGVGRMMVEGGGTVHTQFLTAGLADELHLVIAPFFVGDSSAPRFVADGRFLSGKDNRMKLVDVVQIGDCALLRYALSERFSERFSD